MTEGIGFKINSLEDNPRGDLQYVELSLLLHFSAVSSCCFHNVRFNDEERDYKKIPDVSIKILKKEGHRDHVLSWKMAMESNFKPSVQGDGVNIAFFQQLWQKNRKEVRDSQSETYSSASNSDEQTPLRLPDTVTFQLGQPLQWFFTSERGGNPVILKKRRQNVNVEKVEEVFLEKARASNKGFLHENDIVAYFIASNECTLRNRRMTKQRTLDSESHDGTRPVGPELFAGQEEDSICDIEYFNEEALRKYLRFKLYSPCKKESY